MGNPLCCVCFVFHEKDGTFSVDYAENAPLIWYREEKVPDEIKYALAKGEWEWSNTGCQRLVYVSKSFVDQMVPRAKSVQLMFYEDHRPHEA